MDIFFDSIVPNSVIDLISQMNRFFNVFLMNVATRDPTVLVEEEKEYAGQNPYSEDLIGQDWMTSDQQSEIEVLYKLNGTIGFRFTPDSLRLYVMRLTDEGRRLFGFSTDYLALGDNGRFDNNYLSDPPVEVCDIELPDPLLESYEIECNTSIMNHFSS